MPRATCRRASSRRRSCTTSGPSACSRCSTVHRIARSASRSSSFSRASRRRPRSGSTCCCAPAGPEAHSPGMAARRSSPASRRCWTRTTAARAWRCSRRSSASSPRVAPRPGPTSPANERRRRRRRLGPVRPPAGRPVGS